MNSDFSRRAVLDFLDYLANKGLMNRSTVVSRKAAVNTLLSILDEAEASDLRKLDVDALVARFGNLKGSDFKPDSLRVYRSRLLSVLDDFTRYRSDPLGFKPQTPRRERAERPARAGSNDGASDRADTKTNAAKVADAETANSDDAMSIVFPIPIRPGVIVKIAGIPSDLTPDEAEKIGRVILALSGSQER